VTESLPRIRILPPTVADRIAAGEVVERPASVVKELIENAIDARAAAIQVEMRDGGLRVLRVSDNGHGIPREDVPLVAEHFATSKIQSAEDLAAIRTLGFRGEALSSIAAVARLELVTRTAGELEGTRLRLLEGKPVVEPAASPVGTSVTVRDLFYNTPARRKFLKSPLREAELVQETVVTYSLAYPSIAFRLIADGRERYAAPPATELERIGLAWGRDVAAEMIPISWEALDLRARGYISRPTVARSRRDAQLFFVNGRPVRAGLLAVMLERPYEGRLPPARRPLAVIHLELDPRWVDVNVHPRKAEIRFAQERSVYGALSRAVEEALSAYPRQEGAATPFWAFPTLAEPALLREEGAEYRSAGGLRALAQLHHSYIVAQTPDGMALIDQHAAHEQILFERLLGSRRSKPLQPPLRLEVTSQEAQRLDSHLPLLAELGIELEPFGSRTFLVRNWPESLPDKEIPAILLALCEELGRVPRSEGELREAVASKLACLSAIKAGDVLSLEAMQGLLDSLEAAWSPATCPHGRPAIITLSLTELERRFGRRQ